MKLEQIHIFVSGRVQGVGFRYSTQRKARQLGLTGWVRNTPDGRVEIRAEGPIDVVENFLQWCGEGPPGAAVTGVETIERTGAPVLSIQGFEIVG